MTGPVERCGLCNGAVLETVLSLGSSPPTCNMREVGSRAAETHYPLELVRCSDCTLVQLAYVVDPQDVFPPAYPYSSGHSRALHENFTDLAAAARAHGQLGPDDLVIDIGANDGTLLSKFMGTCRTVGVEPTGQAKRIAGPVYREFFELDLAADIRKEHGPAKVVTACNVLAHVDDINEVMSAIDLLLADDGVLIAENHDLASVVDGGQWDTVYHEHLRFYSPYSFDLLLRKYGFSMLTGKEIATHGGSFRMIAGKASRYRLQHLPECRAYDFEALARSAAQARDAIREQTAGGVVGIGATARATTIINYCGLDVEDIQYVCEVPSSDKIGHYIPGTRIPVVDEDRLIDKQPPRAVLFSWHLADVIVPKLRERGYEGEIILPLPALQVA